MSPKRKTKTHGKIDDVQDMQQGSGQTDDDTRDTEEDGDGDSVKSSNSSFSNADVVQAIKDMEKRVTNKIDGVISVIKELTERVKEAEERISGAEDEIVQLKGHVKTLQSQMEKLTEKADDLENRSRRNNLRVTGLPEKEEGNDACAFLEKWLPRVLEMDVNEPLILERAHRVGQMRGKGDDHGNRDASAPPRTLIMRFLNFKQKEQVFRAARAKGSIQYKDHSIRFYLDVSAEVHRKQRAYDGVRKKLRDLGISKHRVVFPLRLLVTHRDRSRMFENPSEVENFIETLSKD